MVHPFKHFLIIAAQAEGFAIIEATGQAPAAAAVPAAAVQDASVLPGPEDEIAWEAVETAAPAADASSSAAAGESWVAGPAHLVCSSTLVLNVSPLRCAAMFAAAAAPAAGSFCIHCMLSKLDIAVTSKWQCLLAFLQLTT